MRLNTLLETLEITEKNSLRFLFVLQEFLIEKYPAFKTSIVKNIKDDLTQHGDELSLVIKWQLLEVPLLVVPEVLSSLNILILWFKHEGEQSWVRSISRIELPLSAFRADELNFDIVEAMLALFSGKKSTDKITMVKLILMQASNGEITSLKKYFR